MTPQADASSERKPAVFIGSSSEALPIVNRLVGLLGPDFDVHPWDQVFFPGEYTLTALLHEVERADAAIFIFANGGVFFRDPRVATTSQTQA